MVKQKQKSNKEAKKQPKQKNKGYKNRKFETDEEANTVQSAVKNKRT